MFRQKIKAEHANFYILIHGFHQYKQIGFEGGYEKNSPLPEGLIDMTDTSRFFYPWFCFMFYGFNDALLQTYAYWIMGAVTNDTSRAARYIHNTFDMRKIYKI